MKDLHREFKLKKAKDLVMSDEPDEFGLSSKSEIEEKFAEFCREK
jgi:hypothetical protein